MLKTNLKVEAVGAPDVKALSESMRNAFLESLLSDITDVFRHSQSLADNPPPDPPTQQERK